MRSATVNPSGVAVGPAIPRYLHSDLLQHQVAVTPDTNCTPPDTAWSLKLARAATHLTSYGDLESLWWDAPDLLEWVQVQRVAHYNGWLSASRFTKLQQSLPGWLTPHHLHEGARTALNPIYAHRRPDSNARDAS